MSSLTDTQQLTQYLSNQHGLDLAAARRLVEEVLMFYDQTLEDFVRRRHHELQQRGLTNPEAFSRIRSEISERRFSIPMPSERQVRRIIYG